MRENTDQKKLRIWTLFTQCKQKQVVDKVIDIKYLSKLIVTDTYHKYLPRNLVFEIWKHPVEVPRWPFDIVPRIKTKFKELSEEK